MPLTPQDIVRKEFREALRGYNQADVDLFLDEVVEEFSRLSDENGKLKARLAGMQQELGRSTQAGTFPREREGDRATIEAEVRARLRRYYEEQLRALESGASATSATVERVARDLTAGAEERPVDPRQDAPRPDRSRQPFWAGE